MAGHGIPSNYLGATRLDADANACLSLTRAIWLRLSPTQAAAVAEAFKVNGGFALPAWTMARTEAALIASFIAEASTFGCKRLTGLGVMVREAGIYTRENPT